MNRLALRITPAIARTLASGASRESRMLDPTVRPCMFRSLAPIALRTTAVAPYSTTHTTSPPPPTAASVVEASETVSGELELESTDHQRRFLLAFTCKVCNTRQSKLVTHHAYTKGVVLARCDGYWFMEGRNVEEIVQKQNPMEKVQKLTFRAKDPESQAYLERLLKEDPALLERLARAKVDAMRKVALESGGGEDGKPTKSAAA
ncbi:hypothetical protein BCR44DRAFT_1515242 [Catenaria anguillulae PL171]|uniref:DNL-type domain-containing protein n=1 Tax=Catenaria anguillulae PL171 TaxID=765915 RepID=A0A1Y2HDK6_9FUNG|nr:hypothetical protein BCR44DRAFT_1515242 [Catenaria anguillulae PL171]